MIEFAPGGFRQLAKAVWTLILGTDKPIHKISWTGL